MAAGDVYNALAGELRADTRERLAIVRAFMTDRARQRAPHVSGDLRRATECSAFSERFDTFVAELAVDDRAAPHGKWTNEGTGEYVGRGRIYPRRGRVLAFFWLKIGRQMFLASIAGQPGQHWFEGPSGGAIEQDWDDAFTAAWG